jgi:hypothetical protein
MARLMGDVISGLPSLTSRVSQSHDSSRSTPRTTRLIYFEWLGFKFLQSKSLRFKSLRFKSWQDWFGMASAAERLSDGASEEKKIGNQVEDERHTIDNLPDPDAGLSEEERAIEVCGVRSHLTRFHARALVRKFRGYSRQRHNVYEELL